MTSMMEIEIEEAALGKWPRRLLHVPSMTSYEWSPGHRYGNHVAPRYNAITYTWGRWRLAEDESPHIPPIDIRGVPWKVPRVSEDCFTADQLLQVLKKASSKAVTRSTDLPIEYIPEVEFVWLDIACIDQRKDEPRSAAEVGRQALIFKGAMSVFAWLSTIPITTLNDSMAILDEAFGGDIYAQGCYEGNDDFDLLEYFFKTRSHHSIHDALSRLFSDPWFTSLWTLQEAFLRQDAVWISCEGTIATLPDESPNGILHHATLADLVSACEPFADQQFREANTPDLYEHIFRLIDNSGITAISTQNPLAIYTATDHRRSTRTEDRIYGIQQIFGFRLGNSAVNCLRSYFNRDELELQLGEQLLETNPVLSQSHVFTIPAPIGRGWLVNTKSIMPSDLAGHTTNNTYTPSMDRARCMLSVRDVQGTSWGQFEGLVCCFSRLYLASHTFEDNLRHNSTMRDDENFLTIYLDASSDIYQSPNQNGNRFEELPSGPQQGQLGERLYEEYKDELEVMLLGTRKPAEDESQEPFYSESMLGALLLPRNDRGLNYYRRIGICGWDVSLTRKMDKADPDLELLKGHGQFWRSESALFG
ncbi:hypothetical protein GGR52DRAFT_219447 [Hypoxylon sp. FL1284]|nr:hypothetical protein GGR52DRAFT_219447 [Hypoxylon sp. FL1284]